MVPTAKPIARYSREEHKCIPYLSMRHTAGGLVMERIAIVSILTALLVPFMAARATEDGDYKKICRVSENLKVLADSDNNGTIIGTTPFGITDKAARVTTSKLAANTQNTATPEQFAKCAKAWGS